MEFILILTLVLFLVSVLLVLIMKVLSKFYPSGWLFNNKAQEIIIWFINVWLPLAAAIFLVSLVFFYN